LENEKNEIEKQIKYELKDATYGFVGDYRAEWKQFTQNRVDSKKLKAKFREIYAKVVKPKSYRKFAINQI
jgi:predicted phage-related endonuclease